MMTYILMDTERTVSLYITECVCVIYFRKVHSSLTFELNFTSNTEKKKTSSKKFRICIIFH